MNSEQSKLAIGNVGFPSVRRALLQHDAAQREALARLEAERDAMESMVVMLEEKEWAEHAGKGPVSERLENCITTLHNELSEANERADTAQAQLAEAVGLLRAIDRDIWPEWESRFGNSAALINVQAFLADYAQDEQQEALSDAELIDVAMFVGYGNKAARRANALGAAELPEHLVPHQQEARGALPVFRHD